MAAPRIAIDGLWRCLCPSFDSILLSKGCLPVSRQSYRPCGGRRRLGPGSVIPLPMSVICRRRNSSLTSPTIESKKDLLASEIVYGNGSSCRVTPKSNADTKTWDSLPIEELHDLLRTVRDESGAYNKIINLVQYLIVGRGERPNVKHFDALIRANADAEKGSAEVVEGLLRDMHKEGIIGDSGLYHGVLMTLAVHPNHILRAEILEEMKARWISLSPLGYHHLIISHLRDREYELALSVLSSLHDRTIPVAPWLYNILIYVFSEAGELSTALSLLQSCTEDADLDPLYPDKRDVSPSIWPYFLDTCAATYDYSGVLYVWRKRVEIGYLRPSDGTLTNVLNTASLAGDPELATSALKMLAGRKGEVPTSSYEALVEAYATAGDLPNSFRVLCIMGKAVGDGASKMPGSAATRSIFKLLSEGNEEGIREAWGILEALCREKEKIPISAVNVVLEAAVSLGDLDLALTLYKKLHRSQSAPTTRGKKTRIAVKTKADLPVGSNASETAHSQPKQWANLSVRPDTATINLLLQGCAKSRGTQSPKRTAMYLASEMARLQIRPDELTYDRLIIACLDSRERDYEDAFRYLNEMAGMGWRGRLRMGTWHALVRRCASERDDRVEGILEEMEGLKLETGKLRRAARELWEMGPTAAYAIQDGSEDGFERRTTAEAEYDEVDDDVEGNIMRSEDEPQVSEGEQLVWGSLRRKSS